MASITDMSTIASSTRGVLREIASSRSIRLGDLLRKSTPAMPRETVETSLEQLKGLHLIDERSSVLDELRTYFITAEGLEATRKLPS